MHHRATPDRADPRAECGRRVKLAVRLAKAERANPAAARTLPAELGRRLAAEGTVERKPFGESGALSMLLAPRDH